ncbi:hypothetical protein J2W83_004566 [Pseudomonas hunanensis]|uniref:Uncharacterized protein n=1 Tax=Pseudomonas hunanensis TaxID=1247546 RepID=A0ACC6K8W5_9PSED|nr:hypothetical protein [Pseudomonas hunanensis]MDR6714929.1 hypothetical protein [Pseudomonas hunanensis]
MKTVMFAALLAMAALAHAEDQGQDTEDYAVAAESLAPAPETRAGRQKRSVAPIVGMSCEPGYKQVGDECTMANPEFE